MDAAVMKIRQKVNEFASHCSNMGDIEKVCLKDHIFSRINAVFERRLWKDPRYGLALTLSNRESR